MKYPRLAAALALLLAATWVNAQLRLSVTLDRQRYVQYEPIELTVTIHNQSGNALDFTPETVTIGDRVIAGKDRGHLRINIANKVNRLAAPLPWVDEDGNPRVDGDGRPLDFNPLRTLVLPAGATRSLTLKVNSHYRVNQPGDYQATVRVRHQRFRHDYLSKPVRFRVVNTREIWARTIGMRASEEDAKIATRRYVVFGFEDPEGSHFGVRIEDQDYVYLVRRLGLKSSSARPEFMVDRRNWLHMLVQTQPRLFSYWLYDPTGKLQREGQYRAEDRVPRLLQDPDLGRVMVDGTPAIRGIDYNVVSAPIMEIETDRPGR